MVDNNSKDTESRILSAAREVFLSKGMHGARMQEIADKARINKAMLHYYYRNKQKLFEAVFRAAFLQMAPRLNSIINAPTPLFEKIRAFCHTYNSFLRQHPYLPAFIVQELNRDPSFVTNLFKEGSFPDVTFFEEQVRDSVEKGDIHPIDPKQLLINMLALNIFPFVGAPLLRIFTRSDKDSYDKMLAEREMHVSDFIIQAIKIES